MMKAVAGILFLVFFSAALAQDLPEAKCPELTAVLATLVNGDSQVGSAYSEYYGLVYSLVGAWNFGERSDEVLREAVKNIEKEIPSFEQLMQQKLADHASRRKRSDDSPAKINLGRALAMKAVATIPIDQCSSLPDYLRGFIDTMFTVMRAESLGIPPPSQMNFFLDGIVHPISMLVEEKKRSEEILKKRDTDEAELAESTVDEKVTEEVVEVKSELVENVNEEIANDDDVDVSERAHPGPGGPMGGDWATKYASGVPEIDYMRQWTTPGEVNIPNKATWRQPNGGNSMKKQIISAQTDYAPDWYVDYVQSSFCPGGKDLSVRGMIFAMNGCENYDRCGGSFHELYKGACDSHTVCYLCGNGSGIIPKFGYFNGGQWLPKWAREECDDGFRSRINSLCRQRFCTSSWGLGDCWDCLESADLMWQQMRQEGRAYYAQYSPYWCKSQCASSIGNPEGDLVWPGQATQKPQLGGPLYSIQNLNTFAAQPEVLGGPFARDGPVETIVAPTQLSGMTLGEVPEAQSLRTVAPMSPPLMASQIPQQVVPVPVPEDSQQVELRDSVADVEVAAKVEAAAADVEEVPAERPVLPKEIVMSSIDIKSVLNN